MENSLKVFMRKIIDYAGLFPPAELPLDTAIRNYAQYKQGDDSWMLSRFIIPAAKLEKLTPYKEEVLELDPPFDFSLLGGGSDTISEFWISMDEIAGHCKFFKDSFGETATCEFLEIKLPIEAVLSDDESLLLDILNKNGTILAEQQYLPARVFYEVPFKESWKNDIETVLKALSSHNSGKNADDNYLYAGFKIRCGGVDAEMFPSTSQLAYALNRAREYNVAVKCTAGLHHPVRHYNESVKTKMHGFFNVFGGAMLAYAHDLSDEELITILEEEDPEEFVFTDELFSWNNYSIASKEIKELRKVALISYGSCSFDEPREDLKSLGLM